jgi:uncharacterized protein YdcH (DUF465 family)
MKILVCKAAILTIAILSVSSLRADSIDTAADLSSDSPKFRHPVSELRNQDSAFALLIESYRQIQARLIQNDYEDRARAAATIGSLKDRRRVLVLAKQERDLRLEKLLAQLGAMSTNYDYARQIDEREAGVVVPKNVDTVQAAHRLKQFVVITPDSVEQASAKTIPASNYLLSELPAE